LTFKQSIAQNFDGNISFDIKIFTRPRDIWIKTLLIWS